MTSKDWLEAAGYLGSALVLASFLMTSVVRLRIVNMAGSLISFVYALIIRSYPLALMNCALVLINLFFLWKIRHAKNEYFLIETAPDDPVLEHFLEEYRDDILTCFPGIDLSAEKNFACLILCEDAPAGIVLGRKSQSRCDLVLDYSLPRYRDYSLGRFLFEVLPQKGITELGYSGSMTEKHLKYLKEMRFERQKDGSFLCRLP